MLTRRKSTLPLWLGIKLREANQQQQFNRNVEDIELWLYEVEGHLASDDYGKDLTNVQNLQKKHALLEADVAAHQVECEVGAVVGPMNPGRVRGKDGE